MKLSVIIPTRNRSAVLRRSLESLCQQTLFEEMFDIWVIDNGSTDNTALMCEEFCTKLPNLKYHLEPIPGLHSGRHAGLMLSSSDILVFADDDIRAFPTWLEGIAETFNNPKVALVGGKNLPDYVHTPPQWLDDLWRYNEYGRCLGYLALLDFGDVVRSIPPTYIWGCNFAIQRSILIECGGFHPDGMPNEMIRYRGDGETAVSRYVQKKGYLSIYNPKASVYHFVSETRMNKEYIRHRAYLQGISDSYTHIRKSGGVTFKDEPFIIMKNCITHIKSLHNPLRKALSERYWRGYLYHRKEVKKDKELLKWVLKENYINDMAK